jgi:hypothetical protein
MQTPAFAFSFSARNCFKNTILTQDGSSSHPFIVAQRRNKLSLVKASERSDARR